jgi:hypothetical protein
LFGNTYAATARPTSTAATPSLFQFGSIANTPPSSTGVSSGLARSAGEMSSGDGNNDPSKMFKKSPAMGNIAGLANGAMNGEGFHFNLTPEINFNFGVSSQPSNGIIQFS